MQVKLKKLRFFALFIETVNPPLDVYCGHVANSGYDTHWDSEMLSTQTHVGVHWEHISMELRQLSPATTQSPGVTQAC